MTSKSQLFTIPPTLRLGEVIVAAGHPVCVFYRGYPVETSTAIWRYLADAAGPDRALHVHGRAEVRKLEKKPGKWGLVLLHDPKQFKLVGWAIDAARAASKARPSVVYQTNVRDPNAAPLPHVVLEATPGEVDDLMRFFASAGRPIPTEIGPRPIFTTTETLVYRDSPGPFSDPSPALNDRRILFALLCGTRLLRCRNQGAKGEIKIERIDAECVRQLLESRGVTTSLSRAARESLRRRL